MNLLNKRIESAQLEFIKLKNKHKQFQDRMQEIEEDHQKKKERSEDEILKIGHTIRELEETYLKYKNDDKNEFMNLIRNKEQRKILLEKHIEETKDEKESLNDLSKAQELHFNDFFSETIQPLELVIVFPL